MHRNAAAALGFLIGTGFAPALADTPRPPTVAAPAPAFVPREFVTHHEGVFGGERLRYTAIAGDTVVGDDAGQPGADIFAFSYLREDVKDRGRRPVVFVWNGGPGSSSVWEHLGLFGPRRVALRDEVHPPTTPPFALEDNPHALLDVADVVLIDPPGTGFSRVLPGVDVKQFYGVEQDGRAMVDFIETWLRKHDRMNSPRFIIGESYGVTRAIVVSRMLMGGPFTATGRLSALSLNGVVLMGGAVSNGASGDPVGEASYVNNLPTLAASAWYHNRIPRSGRTVEEVIAEAKAFAPEYLAALYAGDRLEPTRRDHVVERLAALTGLKPELLHDNNLRVGMDEFRKALLLDKGLEIGAYDTRFTLPAAVDAGPRDPVADDPAMGKYTPAFVGAFDGYLRNELKVAVDQRYDAIEFRSVNGRWDYNTPAPGGPTTRAQDMAAAMRRNPRLKLLLIGGAYDAVVTMGSVDYSVAHAGLPLDRTTVSTYASGHMTYLGDAPAAALAKDLRAFITSASAP